MKRTIALILLSLLLILSSCFRATETDTSVPMETKNFEEVTESRETSSDDAANSEETTFIPNGTADLTEKLPSKLNIVDGMLVWDETQFPTITSIKIEPNTLTNPNPSKEELSNFLCQMMFYGFSFGWSGYVTPYRIPWDDSVTYEGEHGLECYRFDTDYIKSRQYVRSVIESYFQGSDNLDIDNLIVYNGVSDEGSSDNMYVIAQACVDDWDPNWDPTLFNYVVTKRTSTTISVDIYLYAPNSWDQTASDSAITMVYTDDHLWKVTRWVKPMYGGHIAFAPRDDFGKRLTIEKAD